MGLGPELHSRPWRVGHPALTQDVLPSTPALASPAQRRDPRAPVDDWDSPSAEAGAGRRDSDLAADSADAATLVEALDELPPVGWTGRGGVHQR